MDNRHFDITSCDDLGLAIQLAFGRYRALHWRTDHADGVPRLTLAWTDPKASGWHPFPVGLPAEKATPFIADWLGEQDYGPQPDIDGSCERGFRLYNEPWGHVDGLYAAFVAVVPAWAMFGK